MSSCAGTGSAPATPRSLYTPPGRVVLAVEEQVRHRVGGVRAQRARRGVVGQHQDAERLAVERVDERPDDVGVPALERRDLLVDRALVPGLVGGLDVEQEQIRALQRRERGVALRDVVVVEPGGRARHVDDLEVHEHAEPAHEVDGRRQAALTPKRSVNAGSCGRTPWPQSQICVAVEPTSAAAARTTGFDASMSATSLLAAGPTGSTAGRPVRSCGGTHSASARSAGSTQRWRYSTPAWKRTPSRPPPSSRSSASTIGSALLAREVAGREVDHRAGVVDGDEVAAVRDLVGRELDAHRRGLDRRAAGVVLGGVVAEDREVADVAARREARGDDGRAPDLGCAPRSGRGGAWTRLRAACARRARRAARRRNRRGRARRTSPAASLPIAPSASAGDLADGWRRR